MTEATPDLFLADSPTVKVETLRDDQERLFALEEERTRARNLRVGRVFANGSVRDRVGLAEVVCHADKVKVARDDDERVLS